MKTSMPKRLLTLEGLRPAKQRVTPQCGTPAIKVLSDFPYCFYDRYAPFHFMFHHRSFDDRKKEGLWATVPVVWPPIPDISEDNRLKSDSHLRLNEDANAQSQHFVTLFSSDITHKEMTINRSKMERIQIIRVTFFFSFLFIFGWRLKFNYLF